MQSVRGLTRRLLSLLLALALLASLAACGTSDGQNNQTDTAASPSSTAGGAGDPASGEAVTVTYWTEKEGPEIMMSYAEKVCYQVAAEAMPNIKIEWIHPPKGQEIEQFNLMVVANDKPDLINWNWRTYAGGPDTAIETGVIQDMTGLVDQYMPNLKAYLEKYPDYKRMVSSDGSKLYCVPFTFTGTSEIDGPEWHPILDRAPVMETFLGIIVRGDWLEELGLEEPRTLDEFYNVLKAFKEEKNVPYPFSPTLSFLKTSQVFASAFDVCAAPIVTSGATGTTSGNGFLERDGKAVYGPAEPAYKDYLAFMNRLYTDGLLDPDFAVQDDATCRAKMTSDETGMWLGYINSWLEAYYVQMHEADPNTTFNPIGLANAVQEEGQQLIYRHSEYPFRDKGTAVSSSCENVEAALTYMDWMWSPEGDMAMNWGREGDGYEWIDGWPEVTQSVLDDPHQLGLSRAWEFFIQKNGPIAMDYYNRLVINKHAPTPEGINALQKWLSPANGTESCFIPPITYSSEEGPRIATLQSQISTYASECYVKFIMGEMPMEEFDNYIATLNDLGLEEYVQITQAALDRYNAR